ncbi:uncharacterized protein FIBRA_06520 [Fibroporia radiculosa]|uniref:DUF6534 domain-containing protein n=1 Tax=Fibroporia radiculosa TaxID=599839 RepID=J4GBR2_9APHY|nr:uncharacterized protein FIBRA_06520 [Fibroporia radiculosa]CCM04348.1 predicted protein [Fibroporia radiculosa]
MAEQLVSFGIELGPSLGAVFIGCLFTAILSGISSAQFIVYYGSCYQGDSMVVKCMILVLWMLDYVHLCFIAHVVYISSVIEHAAPLAILDVTWTVPAQVGVVGAIDMIVRGYFIWRIWKLTSHNYFMVMANAVSALFTICKFCSYFFRTHHEAHRSNLIAVVNLAVCIKAFQIKTYVELGNIKVVMYMGLVGAMVADLSHSISLCLLLRRHRSGIRRSDTIIRILTLYTINTGLLPSSCAIACLISFALMPNNLIFLAIYFILPKLLLNSMMAILNARQRILKASMVPVTSIPLGYMPTVDNHSHEVKPLEVSIRVAVDQHADFK